MAIRIRLGDYHPVTNDPLGRGWIGSFPRMTEAEAWEAGRGVWRLDARAIAREDVAVIVDGRTGRVFAMARIHGYTIHGDRKALDGTLLQSGDPLYDAFIGQPDPLANASRNSIAYGPLPTSPAPPPPPPAPDASPTPPASQRPAASVLDPDDSQLMDINLAMTPAQRLQNFSRRAALAGKAVR